jgi:hypothetical protein
MAIPSAPINLLAFPQWWEPPRLILNVLVLPKGDPLAFVPAFPSCTLGLQAALIPGLASVPSAAWVTERRDLVLKIPGNRPALFTALAAAIPVRAHAAAAPPAPPITVKKALVEPYRNATFGARPRTGVLVSEDEYQCAVRDSGQALPPPADPPPTDFYWEEIYSFVLRQPVLARELGLIYETFVDLPDSKFFSEGGFLYVDLAPPSNYAALPRMMFAARIPPLRAPRRVFAAVLFPVDVPGSFDDVWAEAAGYDDGFAKIIHGSQARTGAVLDATPTTMPPPKDAGIRLGWDDEQVAIWLSRQLGVNAYNPGADPPGCPMGVAGYSVDVFDAAAGKWQSLNWAHADLVLGGIAFGTFDGELLVETLPVNLNNNAAGEFWLPSYFATWQGRSLAITDPTPYQIAGQLDPISDPVYTAVGDGAVPLLYGNSYKFRVRLADLTSGGPQSGEQSQNPALTPVATVPFHRFSPPKSVRAARTDAAEPGSRTAQIRVLRPLLGYPDIVFTGFPDAVTLLLAQTAEAQAGRREPALPDPDVRQLRIDVQVETLARDPAASGETAHRFLQVFSAMRDFPVDPAAPLDVNIQFRDVSNVDELGAAAAAAGDPLLVPSARAVRLVLTPIGVDRPDYWGADTVRYGVAPVSLYLSAASVDERKLILPPALGPQIQAIFLQPDPDRTPVQVSSLANAGMRDEAPADLAGRLAAQLDVPHSDLTFSARPGSRTVFAAGAGIRHTLNPDASSITFSARSDLTRHWIVAIRFTIARDWTWNALAVPAFDVLRDGAPVGSIALPGILGDAALRDADRETTTIIWIDAFDPKPGPPPDFPHEIDTTYSLRPRFRTDPESADPPLDWNLRLPITTPPRQCPKLVSAGWAFGPYTIGDRYSSTGERERRLYLQFDGPPADEHDLYFARVLARSPDPMLIDRATLLPDPPEPPLPIDPEQIRAIVPDQPADFAGYNSMTPLIPGASPDCYLVPLPDVGPDHPDLFGFFVYELRVGHDKTRPCTAQARFGPPLSVTGVQHPAPPLRPMVTRTQDAISVICSYGGAVVNGRNLRSTPPHTQMHALLYAQVLEAGGGSWRNALIGRAHGAPIPQQQNGDDPRASLSSARFDQPSILSWLAALGLPLDSPLSVISVEMLPENPAEVIGVAPIPGVPEPLGSGLGQVRILRSSALSPVPAICPPKLA